MHSVHLRLTDLGAEGLQALCGAGNRVLRQIEDRFSVRLMGRPGDWWIEGEQAQDAAMAIRRLAESLRVHGPLDDVRIEGAIRDTSGAQGEVLKAGLRNIRGKTENQRRYLETIKNHVLTLAVGPAGTGKTFLAVAAAVVALAEHEVERIVLTRPAVEAGERLGFLPGDLQQKVDPYLRPLFDALAHMLGVDRMNAMLESGRIEVAPLAYMRGRTLNDAFVILDEAQNTTRDQMKMFLTRLGFSTKMVVTGDVTQVDLADKHASGLLHALQVLKGVDGVGICRLDCRDVIRHPLVERIVQAYERVGDER